MAASRDAGWLRCTHNDGEDSRSAYLPRRLASDLDNQHYRDLGRRRPRSAADDIIMAESEWRGRPIRYRIGHIRYPGALDPADNQLNPK